MTQATIYLQKVITKIQGSKVTMNKMGEFESVIAGLDVFSLKGLSSEKKINIYVAKCIEQGYTLSEKVWHENANFENKPDVYNFHYIFTK